MTTPTGPADPPSPSARALVVALTSAVFLVVLVRTAWICDDAYITFRTVDHFVHGHGLRWNVAERVQSYTHPLWTLLVSGVYLVTREIYVSTLVLAIALSLATFALVQTRLVRGTFGALVFAALALSSQAFVDYSTSGLEGPLTHLLAAVFAVLLLGLPRGERPTARRVGALALVAALAAVNRLDTALLYAPAVAWAVARARSARALLAALAGGAPLYLWTLFSLVYYGAPFPNTAYSKLGVDLPRLELLTQGAWYWLDALGRDPLTPLTVVTAAAAVLVARRWSLVPLLAGVAAYAVYVVWIGGDFMSGRFLTPLFLLSAVLLLEAWRPRADLAGGALLGAVVAVGLSGTAVPLASDGTHGTRAALRIVGGGRDVTDERAFYYPATGLLSVSRSTPGPDHAWVRMGRRWRAGDVEVYPARAAGMTGFYAGPGVHVVDLYALSDPLLARVPRLAEPEDWRIGHFARAVPEGYLETLRTGEPRIEDPDLARFYARLRTVTRGPLFTRERWRAIWALNTGGLQPLVDRYLERTAEAPGEGARAVRGR